MIYSPSQLDPKAKLFFSITIALLAILSSKIIVLLSLFVLLVIFVALGSGFTNWLRYLSFFKVLISVLFVINLFFYGKGASLWGFSVFGLPVKVTYRGIYISSLIILRLVTLAGVSAWFALNTESEEFEVALVQLKVPWKLAFIFSLTLRLIPDIKDRFQVIEEAHLSRGLRLDRGPFHRIRARIPMLIPFFASLIRSGYETAEALKARNFGANSTRTYMTQLKPSKGDYMLYALSFLLLIGFFTTCCLGWA